MQGNVGVEGYLHVGEQGNVDEQGNIDKQGSVCKH